MLERALLVADQIAGGPLYVLYSLDEEGFWLVDDVLSEVWFDSDAPEVTDEE
jgi:hypothetical protein